MQDFSPCYWDNNHQLTAPYSSPWLLKPHIWRADRLWENDICICFLNLMTILLLSFWFSGGAFDGVVAARGWMIRRLDNILFSFAFACQAFKGRTGKADIRLLRKPASDFLELLIWAKPSDAGWDRAAFCHVRFGNRCCVALSSPPCKTDQDDFF